MKNAKTKTLLLKRVQSEKHECVFIHVFGMLDFEGRETAQRFFRLKFSRFAFISIKLYNESLV